MSHAGEAQGRFAYRGLSQSGLPRRLRDSLRGRALRVPSALARQRQAGRPHSEGKHVSRDSVDDDDAAGKRTVARESGGRVRPQVEIPIGLDVALPHSHLQFRRFQPCERRHRGQCDGECGVLIDHTMRGGDVIG